MLTSEKTLYSADFLISLIYFSNWKELIFISLVFIEIVIFKSLINKIQWVVYAKSMSFYKVKYNQI